MRSQITALVTYPRTKTKHIVCFNYWKSYKLITITEWFFSGYIIDSETLKIGDSITIDLYKTEYKNIIENRFCWTSEYNIEVLFTEDFPSWFDKICGL